MITKLATVAMSLACAQANATCFEEAGAIYNVNPDLLRAIAKVESSMRGEAVNTSHQDRTRSVDIGLMQINSRWLKTLEKQNITRESLLQDACLNLKVGAWILADNMRRHGPNWTAVGAYNAACTELKGGACEQARLTYATKVWRALADKRSMMQSGGEAVASAVPTRPVERAPVSRIASIDIGYAAASQLDGEGVGQ